MPEERYQGPYSTSENKIFLYLPDRNFWLRLEKSNQGSGYYTEGWQVKNILDDSQLIVTPARLRMKFQIYCSRSR